MKPEETPATHVRLRQQIPIRRFLTWRDHFFQALEKTGAAVMPA